MTQVIVGLVGPMGVGKGTVAKYLESKGFESLRFSDPIRLEAERRKVESSRQNLQDIGDEWRSVHGLDYISRLLIDKIEQNPEQSFVIDGFRNPGEIEPFLSLSNFILIGLNADPKVRFERLQGRAMEHDPKEWEDFQKQESRDQGIGQPEHGQQVLSSLEKADFVIDTDKVESEVNNLVEQTIKEFQDDPKRTITGRSKECNFC